MNEKRCYIAGAGDFYDGCLPAPGDFIIAADGGYRELISRGIVPDLVVGDFDSLGEVPEHPNIIREAAEKDDTDMVLAVNQGLLQGGRVFIINGGLGGRLDHTMANIQVLTHIAQCGARGFLVGQDVTITAVKDGTIGLAPASAGTISVFCAGDTAHGVTLTGLKYPLTDATLTNSVPLGVSNEFTGVPAAVSVRDGTLIVMWSS